MARLRRKLKQRTRRIPKRKLIFDADKSSYGEECEQPDMLPEQYETARDEFLKNLQDQVNFGYIMYLVNSVI